MAQTKNICNTNKDPFARYKRDVIQIKYEQKHGGQTKMLNLDLIAKQIHMSLKVLVRAMQKLLSVNIRNNHTLTGQWTVDQLESVLQKVIAKHVLCKKCGLPELNTENVCNSCGFGIVVAEETEETIQAPSEFDKEFKRIYERLIVSNPDLIDTLWKCETLSELSQVQIGPIP